MAGQKLSNLPTVSTLADDDLVYVVDVSEPEGSKSKGITKTDLATQIGGAAVWGGITGTLSAQTDLAIQQTAQDDAIALNTAKVGVTNEPSSDPTGVTGADAISNIMSLTQAEFDAIVTPDASTYYLITDA